MRLDLLSNYFRVLPSRKVNLLKNYSHRRVSSGGINLLTDYCRPRPSAAFIAVMLLGAALIFANVFGTPAAFAALFLLVPLCIIKIKPPGLRPVFISTHPYTRPAHFV